MQVFEIAVGQIEVHVVAADSNVAVPARGVREMSQSVSHGLQLLALLGGKDIDRKADFGDGEHAEAAVLLRHLFLQSEAVVGHNLILRPYFFRVVGSAEDGLCSGFGGCGFDHNDAVIRRVRLVLFQVKGNLSGIRLLELILRRVERSCIHPAGRPMEGKGDGKAGDYQPDAKP